MEKTQKNAAVHANRRIAMLRNGDSTKTIKENATL
jgi:hypothetical protein